MRRLLFFLFGKVWWAKRRSSPAGPRFVADHRLLDVTLGAHPYRVNLAPLKASRAIPPPPLSPIRRKSFAIHLSEDMQHLQKRLIGDVLGGRCNPAEALGKWRAAVTARHEECRVLVTIT